MSEVKVNRCYKDRMFVKLFGDPANEQNALERYNAVNGTNYTNIEDLEFYTIENAVYMSMKNDVAICFESILNLFEHQSTLNPNMPVRGLMYYGKLYNKYIEANNLNIYSGKIQNLPTPRYFVFYNGSDDAPEKEILRLTDAFAEPEKSSIEVTATVYNINVGNNRELMKNCRTLSEYSIFMERIRKNWEQGMDMKAAVNAAVDSCIRDGILADFLSRHKAEVMDVVLTEYDEAKHIKMIEKEAEAIGQARGEAIGQARGEAIGQARGEVIGEARGEARGQIKGAIKLGRRNPEMTDGKLVSDLVDLFELTEEEAWEYVRNCD